MTPSETIDARPGPVRHAETAPGRVLLTLDGVGGVGRYAIDLARSLGARGIATLLVGFGPRPAPELAAEILDLADAELVWAGEDLEWTAPDEPTFAAQAAAIHACIRAWKPELIHLNSPAFAADLSARVPTVAMMHSCTATWWQAVKGTPLPERLAWQRERIRRGLARVERVIVPSASYRDLVLRTYGPIDTVRVVANGTARPATVNAQDPFVLAAGRWWDEGKNGAVLDAAAETCTWPVFMAGPLGSPTGETLTLAHAHAMEALPPDAMAEIMRRAAIFVSPSRFEPFGLAVLEAAMCGSALVLSDIPTFREIWDGAALFADADDPAAFAAAIDRLAADAGLRRRLAGRATAIARRFGVARQADATLAVYAEAIAAHRREVH